MEQEKGIAMASEVLITITQEEREQAWALSKLKYELDTQSDLTHAKREGREEGEKKGIQEIIQLLKSGKSPEEIIREYDT